MIQKCKRICHNTIEEKNYALQYSYKNYVRYKMLAEWTSKWIKVVDKLNDIVIDDFDYEHGINGLVTTKHCVKCIAANQCWFIDEKIKNQNQWNIVLKKY